MPDQQKPYRKLPGLGRDVISISRLYQARDHLLVVNSNGYIEDYKRFYFRDIQAIIIRQSITGKVWNWALGALTVPSLAFAIALFARRENGDLPAALFWGVCAILFGVPFLINILRGPTCACHIRTAVQTERHAPLSRLRTAQKVLARIKPLIAEVQGTLAPAEIPQRMRDIAGGLVPYDPQIGR